MGYYVHLHVCFACDTNDEVAALANQRKESVREHKEAFWFLDDLSKRTGRNPGPKGGLSLWGIVGNYSRGDSFCEILRPFWMALLAGVDGGPRDFDRVIVFEEQEQSERTIAFEIYLESPDSLIIKTHECPFSFMQF